MVILNVQQDIIVQHDQVHILYVHVEAIVQHDQVGQLDVEQRNIELVLDEKVLVTVVQRV